MTENLPPFRMWPHFKAAFGGVVGTLNLLVGAVSIFRQIARALAVGLSPVLKNIFGAYVQIFHGLVDFFAGALTWITALDLMPPPWAHDWIVLWFVGAGAIFRLLIATERGRVYGQFERTGPFKWIADLGEYSLSSLPKIANRFVVYLLIAVAWPIVLLDLWIAPIILEIDLNYDEQHPPTPSDFYRLSIRVLFLLQTLAIILAIFGLSVLNAQTTP